MCVPIQTVRGLVWALLLVALVPRLGALGAPQLEPARLAGPTEDAALPLLAEVAPTPASGAATVLPVAAAVVTVAPTEAGQEAAVAQLPSRKDPPTSVTYNNVTYELNDSNKELIDYGNDYIDALGFPLTERQAGSAANQVIHSMIARHHNNDELHQYLFDLAQKYPKITRLHHIGESVEKRKLWVLEITEEPGQHELLKPEFTYKANMHGNEVVGREMLLHLARLLVESYQASQEESQTSNNKPSPLKFVAKLLKATRIFLMPSMNPDGYARADVGCVYEKPSKKGRLNANNVDLNRNFPDSQIGNSADSATQPEVRAVMQWHKANAFVLASNLHGGALVASYPYDSASNLSLKKEDRHTPDDDVFRHLALTYASNHEKMQSTQLCYDSCTDYHPEVFPDGITTGSGWYALNGGMQDWVYENTNCMEITLELGCNQYPAADSLPLYWHYNKRPLLNYIKEVHKGIKGLISDATTGTMLPNVTVHVRGRTHNITSSIYGDYFRLLVPGIYQILYEHPSYQSEETFVTVQDTMAQIINIRLQPLSGAHENGVEVVSPGPNPTPVTMPPITPSTHTDASSGGVEELSGDHSIVVATLFMTIVIIFILLAMGAAYVIQKRRFLRNKSMSVELQPTTRSTGTGIPSAVAGGSSSLHLSP